MNEFTDEKLKEMKEAFELYDTDNDGYLNLQQCDNAYKCLGYNLKEFELNEILDNKNKKINFNDFMLFINNRNKDEELENELLECFKNFDKDCDGKINSKEMKYLLLSLGEKLKDEEVEELISIVDTTGEGAITYKDFVKILMAK
jgi:calmodulin